MTTAALVSGTRLAAVAVVVGVLLASCTDDSAPETVDEPVGTTGAPGTGSSTDPTEQTSPTERPKDGKTRGSAGKGQQVEVLDTLPGTGRARCVSTDGQRDVRSGTMAAGPFDEVSGAESVRLYFIPATPGDGEALQVEATRIDGEGSVSWAQKRFSDAAGFRFYDTTTSFPAAGTWRIEARAGDDRGCFVTQID